MKIHALNVVLAICLMAVMASCGSKASGQKKAEQVVDKKVSALSVKGLQLVNEKGEPVVLHGVSYGWHQFWPRFYNASSVEAHRWCVLPWVWNWKAPI